MDIIYIKSGIHYANLFIAPFFFSWTNCPLCWTKLAVGLEAS